MYKRSLGVEPYICKEGAAIGQAFASYDVFMDTCFGQCVDNAVVNGKDSAAAINSQRVATHYLQLVVGKQDKALLTSTASHHAVDEDLFLRFRNQSHIITVANEYTVVQRGE